jgi:hypothetical protein
MKLYDKYKNKVHLYLDVQNNLHLNSYRLAKKLGVAEYVVVNTRKEIKRKKLQSPKHEVKYPNKMMWQDENEIERSSLDWVKELTFDDLSESEKEIYNLI